MPLITDGIINTTEELAAYENGILDLASTEAIDISQKMILAQDDIALQIALFLAGQGSEDPKAHLRRVMGCADVVATTPLKRWHALKSVALIYQDAFNNQLNDRYRAKWTTYEGLAQASGNRYLESGVGIVANPVPKAPAPICSTSISAPASDPYYVRVSWINNYGQEGAASDAAVVSAAVPVEAPSAPAGISAWNIYAGMDPTEVFLQNAAPLGLADV